MERIRLAEQTWLDYQPASFGSRFLAFFLDLAIRWTCILLLALVLMLVVLGTTGGWHIPYLIKNLGQAAVALVILLILLVEIGYPVMFEVYRNGRTPGKKWVGLQVVTEYGLPLTLRASLLRNMFNIVDALPGAGGVALVAMIVNRKAQRLGDIVAGTYVIYESEHGSDTENTAFTGGGALLLIPQPLYARAQQYFLRKDQIQPEFREKVETTIFNQIGECVDPSLWELYGKNRTLLELVPLLRPLSHRYDARTGHAALSMDWTGAAQDMKEATRCFSALEANDERHASLQELHDAAQSFQRVCQRYAFLSTYYPATKETAVAAAITRRGRTLLYGTRHERAHNDERPAFLAQVREGFRACRYHCACAATLLFGGALLASLLVFINPSLGWLFISEELGARVASGSLWTDDVQGYSTLASSWIMTNNIRVSLTVFTLGISACVGTIVVLLSNGAHLGGTFAALTKYGMASKLGAFILAHGFLELSIIIVSAGAGLFLGDAILNPGFQPRWQAVQERGRVIFSLVVFSAVCLVPAGLIEGFISPYDYPIALKLCGGMLVGGVYWYAIAGAPRVAQPQERNLPGSVATTSSPSA